MQEDKAATVMQCRHRGKNTRKQQQLARQVTSVKWNLCQVSVEQSMEKTEQAHEVFVDHDENGDGVLSYKEMVSAIKSMAKLAGIHAKLTPEDYEQWHSKADKDGDNKIELEEFVGLYNAFVEWAGRVRAKERAKALDELFSKPMELSAEEKALMREMADYGSGSSPAGGSADSSHSGGVVLRRSAVRAGMSETERRMEDILCKSTPTYSYAERSAIRDAFMAAVSGHRFGRAMPGARTSKPAHDHEHDSQGHINIAKIDQSHFPAFLSLLGSIETSDVQERVFEIVFGGRTALNFIELLAELHPVLRGDAEQQAVFMFRVYDVDGQGTLSADELLRVIRNANTGDVIERDVVALCQGKTISKNVVYTLDDYLKHTADHGPCYLFGGQWARITEQRRPRARGRLATADSPGKSAKFAK